MINPMDLSGRNILVTGASSGIGKTIAVYLSKLGANVMLAARDENKLKTAYNDLEQGSHSYYSIDLNNLNEIEGMLDKICSDGRKLNGIVHSAGISKTVPIQFLKIQDLNSIMSVNFYSFMELVKHFTKRKYNETGGSIVAISSISGKVGARGLAAYCASKGALDSAIRALAVELAPRNIRINSIAPGMIKTQIYEGLLEVVNNKDFEADLKKRQFMGPGAPEDVASAAAFLLSDASGFITGTSMIVDGGYLAH